METFLRKKILIIHMLINLYESYYLNQRKRDSILSRRLSTLFRITDRLNCPTLIELVT